MCAEKRVDENNENNTRVGEEWEMPGSVIRGSKERHVEINYKIMSRACNSYGEHGQLPTCVWAHGGCVRAYHILTCSEKRCGVQERAKRKMIEKHEKRGDSVFCVSDTHIIIYINLGRFLRLKKTRGILRSFQLKTSGNEMDTTSSPTQPQTTL